MWQFTYNWSSAAPNQTITARRAVSDTTQVRYAVSCMDGFGRVVETQQTYASASGPILNDVRTDYDALGRKAVVTNAVAGPATVGACPASPAPVAGRDRTAYAYDPLGNVTTTTFLAANQTTGPSTQTTYDALVTTATDENAHRTVKTSNPVARTLTVEQDTGTGTAGNPYTTYATTTYQYDALGRLTAVTDAQQNTTAIWYDLAGRKTRMWDPDMHGWTYAYDAAGKLTTQTDARGITTTLSYDALGRLLQKSYSDATPRVFYIYDSYPDTTLCPQAAATAIGHATASVVGSGLTASETCYDLRGQPVTSREGVGGRAYDLHRTYDDLGQATSLTYPDGEVVSYPADAAGDPTGMTATQGAQTTPLVSQAYATPWGAPSGLTLGATGQGTWYGYDSRERVTMIATGMIATGQGSPWQSQLLQMTYDDAGNVKTVTNAWTETATYTYDDLNRLTGMALTESGQPAPGASYAYDTIGNMTTKQEGTGPAYSLYYRFFGQNAYGAHTVFDVLAGGKLVTLLGYDANGNLCQTSTNVFGACPTPANSGGAALYAYDAEDRLVSMPDAAGGTDTYTYDAGGAMVRRTLHDGSATVYIGGVYEATYSAAGALTGVVKYYPFGGRNVAMRTADGAVHYLLADHLGSTVAVMDANGTIETTQTYWPYGAVRSGGVAQTDKFFTGQRVEPADPAALGLYDYRARFYSTTLGRFVSADPTNGSGLNRYAYVGNSPLRYVDPSGNCFTFPGHPTFSCSEQDVLNWIHCALACGNNWLGDIARYGLGLDEFWGNVFKDWGTSNEPQVFAADIVLTITRSATESTFNAIPAAGYKDLSWMFMMPSSANVYFRASLHDIIFGSDWVRNRLSNPELRGASPWWSAYGTGFLFYMKGGLPWANANKDLIALRDRTVAYGRAIVAGGGDVNAVDWSEFQWEVLAGNVPGVRVPEDKFRCVDDPECLQNLIRVFPGMYQYPFQEPNPY